MSSLGIYFGTEMISLVEVNASKIINNFQVLRSVISSNELEESVPEEAKMVTLLKEEIRKSKIKFTDATISLSGKDLIIRTFDIPFLSRQEIVGAVNFESRKYMPFKVEDLVSDFQLKSDRLNRRNLVLFVGIKKETLNKYLSVVSQVGMKIRSIEYSAFSILRLLTLSRLSFKGIFAVINVDFTERDEVNFTVLENGFPLFSRDIILTGGPFALQGTGKMSLDLFEKLKTEIRISLDYFHRKFPTKVFSRAFFICGKEYIPELEAFAKEIGLSIRFIDLIKYLPKSDTFSLSLIKGYSASLSSEITNVPKINLLSTQTKTVAVDLTSIKEQLFSFTAHMKLDLRIAAAALLMIIVPFGLGAYSKLSLKKKLNNIISMRPEVASVDSSVTYQRLTEMDSDYKRKIASMQGLLKKQVFLTEILEAISELTPEGLWIDTLSARIGEGKIELELAGKAYLEDSSKEFELVYSFLSDLKKNKVFKKYFNEMRLVSLDSIPSQEETQALFSITCKTAEKK